MYMLYCVHEIDNRITLTLSVGGALSLTTVNVMKPKTAFKCTQRLLPVKPVFSHFPQVSALLSRHLAVCFSRAFN